MVYFLGWLAFCQIVFLPGFLLMRYLKIKTKTLIEKAIFSFAFSLIFNYLLVFFLAVTKIYWPFFVYLIFFLEIIFLFSSFNRRRLTINFYLLRKHGVVATLITIVFGVVFFRFLFLFFQNLSLKSVFLTGDVIDSWNQWAVQWAANKLPVFTYHYPQLIPANWSLTYIFMQTPVVEYFAKLLMPLFVIGILLVFFDLAEQTKKIAYIFGAIITGGLLHYYFDSSFLRDGYPDIAFAFFAFLLFYCLILFQKTNNSQYIFLSILFALASFSTKQLGVYIVLLAFLIPIRWNLGHDKKPKYYFFWLLFIFLLTAVTFGWYLFKLPEIVSRALDIENIYHMTTKNIYRNQPVWLRLSQSWQVLAPNMKGTLIVGTVALLSLLSLTHKTSAKVFMLIIFPFFLFWSMFLSYDIRNLVVIFPYFGYTSAIGLTKLIPLQLFRLRQNFGGQVEYSNNHSKRIMLAFPVLYLFLTFFFLVTIVTYFTNNDYLLRQQIEGKKQIGIPELNSRLYDYYYKNGFQGKIATSYYRLCNLPEIGRYCDYRQQFNNVIINPRQTRLAQSSIKYFFYPEGKIKDKLDNQSVIFKYQGWIFVNVRYPR